MSFFSFLYSTEINYFFFFLLLLPVPLFNSDNAFFSLSVFSWIPLLFFLYFAVLSPCFINQFQSFPVPPLINCAIIPFTFLYLVLPQYSFFSIQFKTTSLLILFALLKGVPPLLFLRQGGRKIIKAAEIGSKRLCRRGCQSLHMNKESEYKRRSVNTSVKRKQKSYWWWKWLW